MSSPRTLARTAFGWRACVFAAAAVIVSVAPVAAQVAAESTAAPAPPSPSVILDGRPLFTINADFKARSADRRAAFISERLTDLARNPSFRPESIRVVETDISDDVVSGDDILFSIFDPDTARSGRDRHALAVERAEIARAAMLRYRAGYGAKSIAWGLLWIAVATLTLVVVLRLLGWLHRWLRAMVAGWAEARRDKIRARTFAMLEAGRLVDALHASLGALRTVATVAALLVYAGVVLSLFPWTRSFASHLAGIVLDPLRGMALGVGESLPGLVFIAVLWIVTYYLIKLVQFFFNEIALQRIHVESFYPEWAMPTFRLVRLLLIAFALVVAYPYIPGSSTDAFRGVSIFLGLLVSLGSSSAVGNIVAGVILVYMRSFRVGDIIQIGDHMGLVIETKMFTTRLRTPWNVEINIPNAVVMSSHVVNYSAQAADRGLILHSEVSIGYNWPWRQVHELLLRAAARTEGLLEEPAPFVRQRTLGDFGVSYQINAYTKDPEHMLRTYSALHKHIQDEFNEFGVEIMTPAYEGDRDSPTLVPKSKWYAAPARQPGEPGADD